MRHKLLIVLLGLGTIGGYAAGFAGCHMRAHHDYQGFGNHRGFHERVADTCVEAALRVRDQASPSAPASPQIVVVPVPMAIPPTVAIPTTAIPVPPSSPPATP